jgi:hypothetical protein
MKNILILLLFLPVFGYSQFFTGYAVETSNLLDRKIRTLKLDRMVFEYDTTSVNLHHGVVVGYRAYDDTGFIYGEIGAYLLDEYTGAFRPYVESGFNLIFADRQSPYLFELRCGGLAKWNGDYLELGMRCQPSLLLGNSIEVSAGFRGDFVNYTINGEARVVFTL